MADARGSSRFPHPLALTLGRLPELELFPTPETREHALDVISDQPRRPGRMVTASLVAIAAMVTVSVTARWAIFDLLALPLAAAILLFALILAVTLFTALRVLHRRVMRSELRHQLVAIGVPVCMGCGYALRGLAPETRVCPECGRAAEAHIRALMDDATDARGPDRVRSTDQD